LHLICEQHLAFTTASLWGSETAVSCDLSSWCHSSSWFLPGCHPPYNTGVSECSAGRNPCRETLCSYPSCTQVLMEVRTKLHAWHTPSRRQGSRSVPVLLDKTGQGNKNLPPNLFV